METLLGTQLHWLTLVFIVIEFSLFTAQLFHYLNRPGDRQRLWYLLLLALLIIYNLANGFFPDPARWPDMRVQVLVADGFAYLMGAYIPWYFYKAYELKALRWQVRRGVPLFILLPFAIFSIAYLFNNQLPGDREWTVLVPALYGMVVLWAMLRAILVKYRETGNRRRYRCELAVWLAILPWEAMAVFAFYPAPQWLRILLANLGWLVITVLQFEKAVRHSRRVDQKLRELTRVISTEEYLANCRLCQFSERETDIALLFREELTSREIGERLFISEMTVKTHITNMLRKTGDHNRRELVRRLSVLSKP
jgi:DNA-binding CsgD family transcriptional regulator